MRGRSIGPFLGVAGGPAGCGPPNMAPGGGPGQGRRGIRSRLAPVLQPAASPIPQKSASSRQAVPNPAASSGQRTRPGRRQHAAPGGGGGARSCDAASARARSCGAAAGWLCCRSHARGRSEGAGRLGYATSSLCARSELAERAQCSTTGRNETRGLRTRKIREKRHPGPVKCSYRITSADQRPERAPRTFRTKKSGYRVSRGGARSKCPQGGQGAAARGDGVTSPDQRQERAEGGRRPESGRY